MNAPWPLSSTPLMLYRLRKFTNFTAALSSKRFERMTVKANLSIFSDSRASGRSLWGRRLMLSMMRPVTVCFVANSRVNCQSMLSGSRFSGMVVPYIPDLKRRENMLILEESSEIIAIDLVSYFRRQYKFVVNGFWDTKLITFYQLCKMKMEEAHVCLNPPFRLGIIL